jgi:serine/threonine-protein kinase
LPPGGTRLSQDQLQLLRASLASRYRVERELGRGGMATVYLAHDLKHGRPVALKALRPEFAAVLGAERFLREIQIAARLQHPNILALYDSGEADGTLYYIMPYVDGESLRDRLTREGALPLADALRIAGDVAQALSYAHAHDVVHRDIKPENILLSGERAVVADFGIARAVTQAAEGRLTQTGIAVGTPVYMSPEQAGAASRIDGRSDIYSLACVVYEMLAGHPPFTGTTPQELMARHSIDAVPSLRAARPSMPEDVEAAIQRALQKSPADRFATASQFADALGDTGPKTSAVRRAWPPARRVDIAVAAAVVIVAIVIATFFVGTKGNAGSAGAASRVVVMPFENRTAQKDLDPLGIVVAEWVTQGLAQTSFLSVLDTRGAQATAARLGSAPTPADVGRETGAGVVVAGSYILRNDSLEFQARISSTADDRILSSISGVTVPRDRPMSGVERLQQRLLGAFASLQDKDVSAFQTTLAQPPSYAAYRAYAEGIETYLAGELAAAPLFLRAATLDSSFLAARIWAAQTDIFGGGSVLDHALVRRGDSLLAGLEPLRDRLSSFDRARLDFVVTTRAGDGVGAYDAALRMVAAAPGSVDARREAALAASRIFRSRESLARFQELDPQRGLMRGWEAQYWYVVSSQYHVLGEFDAELVAIRRARHISPTVRWYLFCELRALGALGRIGEMDSVLAAEVPATWSQRGMFVYELAGELMAHGQPEAARRVAQEALDHPQATFPSEQVAARDWFAEHTDLRKVLMIPFCYLAEPTQQNLLPERAQDEWVHWRVELALLLGHVDQAAELFTTLRQPVSHGLLRARVLAAQGKVGDARATMAGWERRMVQSRGTLNGLEMDRAAALVRFGDRERALEILAEGIGRRFLPDAIAGWNGHAHPEFAPLWSDPRFRALIKPRG